MRIIFKLVILILCLFCSFSANANGLSCDASINNFSYLELQNNKTFSEITNEKDFVLIARNTRNEEIYSSNEKNNDYNNELLKKNFINNHNIQITLYKINILDKFRTAHKISPILEHAIIVRAP